MQIKHLINWNRHSLMLMPLLLLHACGGSGSDSGDGNATDTYQVGGNVSGLTGTLLLSNNSDSLSLNSNGEFSFNTRAEDGATYDISVQTQPVGQECSVSNASGTITAADVDNISVSCTNLSFTIGGTLSGLQGSLVLLNNRSDALDLSADGVFSFTQPVNFGSTYSVTVQTHPAGQFCSVSQGDGTVNGADVDDISVTCADLKSVGGVVSGLSGTLQLQNNGTDTIILNANGSYSFPQQLQQASLYNVQVSQQPVSQICSVINASGQIIDADVMNVDVLCTAETVTVSLSGSYQIAPLTEVDSDINDAFAPANVTNNMFNTAQSVANFTTIHGFATNPGTGRAGEGDRFEVTIDEWDVYRVQLQQNQTIRMQVVDFEAGGIFQGDLDLYLFDDGFNLVDPSFSTDEYEQVTVSTGSGEYYIAVNAWHDGVSATSSSSKYTLVLDTLAVTGVQQQNSMDFVPGEAIVQFNSSAQAAVFNSNNLGMRFSHQEKKRATLARFDDLPTTSLSTTGSSSLQSFETELGENNPQALAKFNTLQKIKQLNLRRDIDFAEPNYIYHPKLTPDDSYYSLQWHYPAINLPQAWDLTTGVRSANDVIVAVVDTGVFLAHPDLSGQLVSGYDFISNADNAADGEDAGFVNSDIDANPDDPGDSTQVNNSSWHGTHVAGTVAAASDNNSGITGIAWGAKIMPLRVLGTQGGSNYDIIQAIRFAAGLSNDSGTVPTQIADVINLSLGGSGYSQAAQNAYTAVRDEGVIVVAAAGNENTSQLSYPASYDGVISVSATDFEDQRAPYSNFGSRIDVAAPGGNTGADINNDGYADGVLSTLVDDSSGTRVATYSFYQGTSMASPHMAGVVALMRAVHPTLSPADLDDLLSAGSITSDLGDAGRDDIYGHGMIDAFAAVQAAQQLANGGTLPTQPAIIVASPAQLSMGITSQATVTISNEGGESASITGVSTSASWLGVSEISVDAEGLGDYQVSIDRNGLADSIYTGSVTFSLSTGSSLELVVTMQVGMVNSDGNVGQVYMVLLDENSSFVDNTLAVDQGNGVYDYSFTGIGPGTYRIIAGSDVDNDNFICQLAEACGGYPTIGDLEDIEVLNTDITQLDFVVDILSNFGASASGTSVDARSTSINRPPLPSKQLAQ